MSDRKTELIQSSLREKLNNEFFLAIHRDFGLRRVEDDLADWHRWTWTELHEKIKTLLVEEGLSSCSLVDWENYLDVLQQKWRATESLGDGPS